VSWQALNRTPQQIRQTFCNAWIRIDIHVISHIQFCCVISFGSSVWIVTQSFVSGCEKQGHVLSLANKETLTNSRIPFTVQCGTVSNASHFTDFDAKRPRSISSISLSIYFPTSAKRYLPEDHCTTSTCRHQNRSPVNRWSGGVR